MIRPGRPATVPTLFLAGALSLGALAGSGCVAEDASPNLGQGWSEGSAWEVVERTRIGSLDGAGPDVFGEVRALAVGPDGEVYVFDRMAHEVRRFSPEGDPEWVFGGPGSGPGEFGGPADLTVAPNGRLWVVDVANRRYTIVAPDRTFRMIPREGNMAGRLLGFTPAGTLLDAATAPDAEHPSYRLLEIDADGAVLAEFVFPLVSIRLPTLGLGIMVPLPHAPAFLRAVDPGGAVWHATTGEYRIVRSAFSGDTTAIAVGHAQPSPLTSEEHDAVAEGVRDARARFSVQVEDDMIPTSIGPLRWMVVDDAGNLWVCATGRDPCDRLDVFDPSGVLLGTVRLPVTVGDQPRPVIRGNHFVAATTGPAGEPQVFVGTVSRPGAATASPSRAPGPGASRPTSGVPPA